MAKVGYARVSTVAHSLEVQLAKLKDFGCDEIFKDKHTGTTADRPKLKQCRKYVRKDDSLVITKLDRLARSTFHLTQIAEELKDKGVDLIVLDPEQKQTTETIYDPTISGEVLRPWSSFSFAEYGLEKVIARRAARPWRGRGWCSP